MNQKAFRVDSKEASIKIDSEEASTKIDSKEVSEDKKASREATIRTVSKAVLVDRPHSKADTQVDMADKVDSKEGSTKIDSKEVMEVQAASVDKVAMVDKADSKEDLTRIDSKAGSKEDHKEASEDQVALVALKADMVNSHLTDSSNHLCSKAPVSYSNENGIKGPYSPCLINIRCT